MKRSFTFLSMFQPLYVILAGLVGLAFAYQLFLNTFPLIGDTKGKNFAESPNFLVFVFVLIVVIMFMTIVILPLWKQLIDFIQESISGKELPDKYGIGILMIIGGVAFGIIFLFFLLLSTVKANVVPSEIWPEGLNERIYVLFIYALITVLPIPLITLLVYANAHQAMKEISLADNNEAKLFLIAQNLLRYRNLLQNSLLVMGVLVSMLPVVAAVVRSVFLSIDKQAIEEMFPVTNVIAFGLSFTTILILFYAPSHIVLTQVGQKLRDALCPIDSLSDLDKNLKRRKDLDEWLQINLSLTQNLKAGIVTLAPLITSFVTSFLGVKF